MSDPRSGDFQSAYVVGRHALIWRKTAIGFALHRSQTRRPLLHVVPDALHTGMWRIQLADGDSATLRT
jgi:hypothetical protein